MPTPSHARPSQPPECPSWCVGRKGQPHDADDIYGVAGVHHDSELMTVSLGNDGSQVHVRASRFVPATGTPWSALVEVDADLSPTRQRCGPRSVWLTPSESAAVITALELAAGLTAKP